MKTEESASNQYQDACVRLESSDYGAIKKRLSDRRIIRLRHVADGLVTEAAEVVDQLKRHTFYGSDLDETNLLEELGDVLWYCAVALDELGFSFEDCMAANLRKLHRRNRGDRFNGRATLDRDTEAEIVALKGDR